MAVARVVLDTRGLNEVADACKKHPALKYAAREFARAAQRPGKRAELTADEVRALVAILEDCPPRTRQVLREALERVEETEREERARPRARDLIMAKQNEVLR